MESGKEMKGGKKNSAVKTVTAALAAIAVLCIQEVFALDDSTCTGRRVYCVIDVSGGVSAASYPISYLDKCPDGGWGNEFKTTKIVLRRIEPGRVVMAGVKPVTITKPYYISVFEITQKQYKLVTGLDPSQYKGDTRPVECVSWNTIRGKDKDCKWPAYTNVAPNSFIGRLRTKTGKVFDLPTEAQWEHACRAGTTSAYNNGGSGENDLRIIGRFAKNRSDGRGSGLHHTDVGSYAPNAWGLYDMHGNVREWCLDWSAAIDETPATDYLGPDYGSERVRRGGSWDVNGKWCTSVRRDSYHPAVDDNNYDGIRLVGNM